MIALLIVAVVGVAAGCGSNRGVLPPAPCHLSEFSVSVGPGISEATGQHTLVLRLVNHGGSACVLDGYPRLTFSDAAGAIPFVIRDAGDMMVTPHPPRPVLVSPGGYAWIVINQYRCDGHTFRGTRTIRIDSPVSGTGATRGTMIMFAPRYFYNPSYCGKGDPGSVISVSPFVATYAAGLAH